MSCEKYVKLIKNIFLVMIKFKRDIRNETEFNLHILYDPPFYKISSQLYFKNIYIIYFEIRI